MAEERISGLEDRSLKIVQFEELKENRSTKQSLIEMWGIIKFANIGIMGRSEGEVREKEKEIFEEREWLKISHI